MPIIGIKVYWTTFSNNDRNNSKSLRRLFKSKEKIHNCRIDLCVHFKHYHTK